MAVTLYRKTALTGGGSSALDGIDGDTLNDGDICLTYVQSGSNFIKYHHYLDADSGAAESSPSVIVPDTNPGSKAWHLLEIAIINVNLISTGIIYFGDASTNGSWKIERSGNNLRVFRRESGSWVDKGGFNP